MNLLKRHEKNEQLERLKQWFSHIHLHRNYASQEIRRINELIDSDRLAKIARSFIYSSYNIKLEWGEAEALKYYLKSFCRSASADSSTLKTSLRAFMIKYFELDAKELGNQGLKLLDERSNQGTRALKEYCEGHVDQWRDERNLI